MNIEVIEKYEIYALSKTGELKKAESLPENGISCVLGCFDGVHRGHLMLTETARTNFFGYTPAVWTFSQPLCKEFIESVPDRLALCGKAGMEIAFCEEFEEVKRMPPEQFIHHLYNDFGVRHFICGRDFRFGADRAGDPDVLKRIAFELGACVTVVPHLTVEMLERRDEEGETKRETDRPFELDMSAEMYAFGEKVSSTLIRQKIAEGDVSGAARLLGRRFGITATVCDGKQLGRKMGMPTINQRLEADRVAPKFGVYYSYAVFDGIEHPAVTNIGIRPTVNSDAGDVTCETHILDCNAELYGKTVRVELCEFAREEQKFGSIDELKSAIAGNIADAKTFFGLYQN